MSEIGNFFVSLGSKFDPKGVNQGSTAMNKFKMTMQKVGAGLKTIALAGIAMGAALAAGAMKAAGAAGIQEKAEFLLANALKNVKNEAGLTIAELKEFASDLQKITTVGDETTLELMRMGVSMGINTDQIKKATVQAIGLSKSLKVDLTASMKMIALARQGEFSMLARYIPQLRNTTDKTEQAAIVNEVLARSFKDAEAETETHLGRVQQLGNRWGDFVEKIGFIVIPFMTKLFDAINTQILPVMENWIGGIKESDTALKKFGEALKFIINVAKGVILVFDLLADGISGIILLLTGEFKAASDAFKEVKDKFVNFGQDIIDAENATVKATEEAEKKKISLRINSLAQQKSTFEKASKDEMKIINKRVRDQEKREKKLAKIVDDILTKREEQEVAMEERRIERNALRIENVVATIGMISEVAQGFADFQNVNITKEMNDDIAASKAKYDERKKWIEENITDEAEKNRMLDELEKGHSAAVNNIKEAADREERKRKEALKPVLIAEATANTAVAVTKALTSTIPPFNIVLGALVGAAGAIQIAKIGAQKFAKGVRNFVGGMALVGEEGPELVNLPRGADVITAPQTERLTQGSAMGGGDTINIINPVITSRRAGMDLTREVGKNIMKKVKASRRV